MRRSHRSTEPTQAAALWRLPASHLLLASLAGALSIAACNSVAGLDELTFTAGSGAAGGGQQGGGGASGSCDLEPAPDACTECTYDECNADYCACMADEFCLQTYNCANACVPNDIPCEQNCMQQYPDGISQTLLLFDCAAGRCPNCPTSAELTHCERCLFSQCPEVMNECISDTTCLDYVVCFTECYGDGSCIEACGIAYPVTTGLLASLLSCGEAICGLQCSQ